MKAIDSSKLHAKCQDEFNQETAENDHSITDTCDESPEYEPCNSCGAAAPCPTCVETHKVDRFYHKYLWVIINTWLKM